MKLDRAAALRILDPSNPIFETGTDEDTAKARAEWHRQRFVHQVMSRLDLEEIPRSRLRPIHGARLLEDTENGNFYVARRDGIVDVEFVKSVTAYYCDAAGTPVLLEPPASGVKTRSELEQHRAEREQRRNAPRPRPRVTRR